MNRVILIHWNKAEAAERVARLKAAGWNAESVMPQGTKELKALAKPAVDALVIDLSRLPSQGREIGGYLRRQKTTRHIPLVFVGGDPVKVAVARKLLPDAKFTDWPQISAAIRQAIQNQPAQPVVPNAMAAYAGAPLPKKLGIRAGSAVALLGAPKGFQQKLAPLPANVRVQTGASGKSLSADVILLFNRSRADLERRFASAARLLAERGRVWIIWPKKTSGVASNLNEKTVRAFGLQAGFVDYKICAVDETWSGLLFVRRRKFARPK